MNLKRFLILAVVGFALGASLAYFQNRNEPAPVAIQGTAEQSADHAGMDHGAEGVEGSVVGGPFSLTDHNNAAVTDKSWPGKNKLVFFGFTNCPDICPQALDKIKTALAQVPGAADKIQVLFITTDPARDTPEALKTYLGNVDPSYVGLTGTEQQLKEVRDAYKAYAAPGPKDAEGHETMNHSGYIYLMSEDNKLLDIMNSSDAAEDMVKKIQSRLDAQAAAATTAPAATETDAATPAAEGAAAPEAAPASETPATADAPAMPAPAAPATDATAPAADAPAADTAAPAAEAPSAEVPAAEAPAEERAPE